MLKASPNIGFKIKKFFKKVPDLLFCKGVAADYYAKIILHCCHDVAMRDIAQVHRRILLAKQFHLYPSI